MRASRSPSSSSTPRTEQGELFAAAAGPRGFVYAPGFIEAAEEGALLEAIAPLPFEEAVYKLYRARRRTVMLQGPLPAFLAPLAAKTAVRFGVSAPFVHALINEYRPGTPLGWHRDAPEFGLVCGVSLASACRMRFRPYKQPGGKREVLSLELAPRSAYLMSEDARWQWQHSVAPTEALRYSVTFRTSA